MKYGAFILFFLVGCASITRKPEPVPALTGDVFLNELGRHYDTLAAVSGKVFIKYKGRQEGISGKGRLTIRQPQNGRWELRDPLGRVQYVATLNPGDFTAYYPTQKLAYHDEAEGKLYSKLFLGFELGFGDMQKLILGLLPFSKAELSKSRLADWSWDAEKGLYRGVIGHLEPVTVYVNETGTEIRELHWAIGSETVMVKYSDFDSCCGKTDAAFRFPYSAQLSLQKAGTSVQIQWDDIAVWQASGDDAFRVDLPQGIEVRALR